MHLLTYFTLLLRRSWLSAKVQEREKPYTMEKEKKAALLAPMHAFNEKAKFGLSSN